MPKGRQPGAVSPYKQQREAFIRRHRLKLKKKLAKMRQEIRHKAKETGVGTIDAEAEALKALYRESKKWDRYRSVLGATNPRNEKLNTHPGELVKPAPAGLGVRSIAELEHLVYPRKRKKNTSKGKKVFRKCKKTSPKAP